MEFITVTLASFLAGFVDAIVGGGGLVLVPALFATFPNTHPATLFGVNKSASMWGHRRGSLAVCAPRQDAVAQLMARVGAGGDRFIWRRLGGDAGLTGSVS